MMGHTKEPWKAMGKFDDRSGEYIALIEPVNDEVYRGDILRIQSCNCISGISDKEAEANAARIVACVNAFEGIDDPAAFMADVREYMGPLKTKPVAEVSMLVDRIKTALGMPRL